MRAFAAIRVPQSKTLATRMNSGSGPLTGNAAESFKMGEWFGGRAGDRDLYTTNHKYWRVRNCPICYILAVHTLISRKPDVPPTFKI